MKNWLISFLYALIRFSAGLLLHPYQTMQILVEQRLFVWVALFPTLALGVLTIMWKMVLLPFFALLFSPFSIENCWFLSFLSTWITLFMIYWQVMLLYLLYRFRSAVE